MENAGHVDSISALRRIVQQVNFNHRGEQGLFESVGFRLFELCGDDHLALPVGIAPRIGVLAGWGQAPRRIRDVKPGPVPKTWSITKSA